MKTTDLIVTLHEREPLWGNYPVPSQAGGGLLRRQPFAVITIDTDEGVQGHAFLGPSAGATEALVSQVVKLIKPGLIGPTRLTSARSGSCCGNETGCWIPRRSAPLMSPCGTLRAR